MYAQKSVVLITGATGPIGSAIAREFAKVLSEESQIIITSRSLERLDSVKESLEELNPLVTVRALQWALDKPDTEHFRKDLEASTNSVRDFAGNSIKLRTSKFENAIIVHNATEHGNFAHSMLDVGANLPLLHEALNINVLSTVAITTAFFEAFGQASHKVVVNMTAHSADNAYPSYGYNSICKSAKKMALNILAKERDDIKVLHFNPASVDTPAFHQILDQSFNAEIRAMFQKIIDDKQLLPADHVAHVL
uniref:Sepiapterin reductase n=1 Tax=Acrobeloides nanus TaxID=290746 RepID=A0A914BYV0_9BILA